MKMKVILCLLFSFCLSYSQAQSPIKRVEPTNWWVGMKHNKIQLLVYGQNIAHLQAKIDYPGVSITRTIGVDNPNYLFLNLSIAATTKAGTVNIDFSKNGQKITSHAYPLLERDAIRSNIDGFDASDAIYLITPDRFANGNPKNDNVKGMREQIDRKDKGGRHGGDIEGIRKNLDYIKDLGFTAVWLNPLLENDMEEYSYHGYSTTDFYKVDSRYGSNKEYQALADEARKKGLKLIMDMIVNHCGSFHWWMNDLPSEDWINQWPTYTETSHRKTVLQDPYVAKSDKKIFTDGWFVPTMPDMNQRNDLMATYLIQNSIWWVEYLGLSGIRMDTYPYPDEDFMTDWTESMMLEYPNLNIVGEEWYEEPTIVSYWQKGKVNPNGYTSELKSVMDFPMQMTLVKALNDEEAWKTGWIALYELMAQDFLYPDPLNLVIFPDNHDMSRIYTQVNEDYDLYKQAITYILTTRGIPQIYYGTEILMSNKGSGDHGIIRSDFPGGWKGDKSNGFSGKGLTSQQKEAKEFLAKLLKWRKNETVIHNGKMMHFLPKDGVYVYFRYNDSKKIMIVLNKNKKASDLDLSRFKEMLTGHQNAKVIFQNKTVSLSGKMQLAPKSALVLELN